MIYLSHFDKLCYVATCHEGMERPRVADGGDDLQIWRVAASILHKQLRTTDWGWSSNFWDERGANNPSP